MSLTVRFDPQPEELQRLHAGPLGPHIGGFAALISQLGYCRAIGWQKIRLLAELGRWLQRRRTTLAQLHEEKTSAFLQARWRRVSRQSGDQITMGQLLQHLRQAHVIPPVPSPPPSESGSLEQAYRSFLLQERALAPASVEQYAGVMRRFLSHRFPKGKVRLRSLRAEAVTDFVLHDTSGRGRRSAQLMATVLRSFLGFLFQQGRTATNLAAAVPTVAGWRLSELPRFLEPAQVEQVLRSCDRRRKVGLRDYAVLLLLARLGLRAGSRKRGSPS